jgi:hypothetical protein
MPTEPEKAWYVPADAIWDDPYWRPINTQESEPTE